MASSDLMGDFWGELPVERDERATVGPSGGGAGRTDGRIDRFGGPCGSGCPRRTGSSTRSERGLPQPGLFQGPERGGYGMLYEDGTYAVFVNDAHLFQIDGTQEPAGVAPQHLER